jgi:hypothetical protein
MPVNQSLPALPAKKLLPRVSHKFKLSKPFKLFKSFAVVIQHLGIVSYRPLSRLDGSGG